MHTHTHAAYTREANADADQDASQRARARAQTSTDSGVCGGIRIRTCMCVCAVARACEHTHPQEDAHQHVRPRAEPQEPRPLLRGEHEPPPPSHRPRSIGRREVGGVCGVPRHGPRVAVQLRLLVHRKLLAPHAPQLHSVERAPEQVELLRTAAPAHIGPPRVAGAERHPHAPRPALQLRGHPGCGRLRTGRAALQARDPRARHKERAVQRRARPDQRRAHEHRHANARQGPRHRRLVEALVGRAGREFLSLFVVLSGCRGTAMVDLARRRRGGEAVALAVLLAARACSGITLVTKGGDKTTGATRLRAHPAASVNRARCLRARVRERAHRARGRVRDEGSPPIPARVQRNAGIAAQARVVPTAARAVQTSSASGRRTRGSSPSWPRRLRRRTRSRTS